MSATTDSSGTNSPSNSPEFVVGELQDRLDLNAQPASALIDAFDGWAEIHDFDASDSEWTDLDGIGPASAEALEEGIEDLPDGTATEGEDATNTDAPDEPDSETGSDSDSGPSDGDSKSVKSSDEDDQEDLFELRGFPTKFEAVIEHQRISEAVETVGCLVDECKIRISEDRLAIRAVDPANVGMVDLELAGRGFASLEAAPGVIGVNVERLSDVLGMGSSGDMVEFSLDSQTRKLDIRVDGVEYTIALLDPDSIRQEPQIPDLDLWTDIRMTGETFDKAVTAAKMVSDHMEFNWEGESIEVLAEGDSDDINFDLSREENVSSVEWTGDGKALYSLDYLKDLNKMIPSKKHDVSVRMGDEMPMKLRFTAGDDHVEVETMLAPRIQAD